MLKKIFLVTIILGVVTATFISTYISMMNDFKITAEVKKQDLNLYIKSGIQLIDMLEIHGERFLENGIKEDSRFVSMLNFDQAKNSYNLDAVGNTEDEQLAGNLTGLGEIPNEGILRDEINLAFDYNEFFCSYYDKFPDIAWVYYTSENNFINIYPWTPSEEFTFPNGLKSLPFYDMATPENDPLRQRKWTPVYLDAAGKGLMVTLSKPVYYQDLFMGVVSIDITNELLTKLISSKYQTYLYDDMGTVLAANQAGSDEYSMKSLHEYLNVSNNEISKLNSLKRDSIEWFNGYFIYNVSYQDVPWHIILLVPAWLIIGKSILVALPFLVISFLMLLFIYQTNKRRKSEQQYAAVIETTQDAFWICDRSGRYLQVNDALCVMLGYSRAELLNMTIADTVPGFTEEEVAKRHNKIMELGSEQFESNHICKNGRIITVEVSATYMPDSGYFCGFTRDITERKQKEQKIAFLSYHDSLTGLYNRSYFEEECRRLDIPSQLPITVLMGDVNGLKLTNDVFGHAYGDRLLVFIGEILKKCSRSEDIIARTGGDEFCILLTQSDHQVAQKICDRIYATCEIAEIKLAEGFYHPSVSLGFATKEKPDQSLSDIIREAENSMYKHKLLESKSAHSSIIASIRTTIFEKSHETREHADRISALARKVGEALELPYDQLSDLELLGALHDVGKIGVDSHILQKIDPLTEEEWMEIKKHPEIGYRIAKASGDLHSVAEGILSHHERWDGKGYPQGLAGEKIPLLARIIAVVDSFDAMTHDRYYRKALDFAEAKQEILANIGKQFDPAVAETFLNIIATEDMYNI